MKASIASWRDFFSSFLAAKREKSQRSVQIFHVYIKHKVGDEEEV